MKIPFSAQKVAPYWSLQSQTFMRLRELVVAHGDGADGSVRREVEAQLLLVNVIVDAADVNPGKANSYRDYTDAENTVWRVPSTYTTLHTRYTEGL